MTQRIFTSLPVPSTVRDHIAELQLHWRHRGWKIRWVDPSLMHVTMHFLGETPLKRIDRLREVLKQQLTNVPKISLTLGEAAAFPELSKAKVLYLSVNESPSAPLAAVEQRIGRSLVQERFLQTHKAWHPHITLGRFLEEQKISLADTLVEPLRWQVTNLDVVASRLGPAGPEYRTLDTLALLHAD